MVEDLAVTTGPRVVSGAKDALRVVLRRQVTLDVIPTNPCQGVRAPAVDTTPARFLTVAEAGRLQTCADGDKDGQVGPFVALALATGMRRGELEAWPWGRVGWTSPSAG